MSDCSLQNSSERVRRAFFIDSENGLGTLLAGYSHLNQLDMIVVFHRGSVSDNIRKQLSMAHAQIDWVQCGDPKIKNSMDFQIVAELAVCLAFDRFDEAYVVSRDNGFQAAVHYLERQPIAQSHILKCVKSISQGLYISVQYALASLEKAESMDDIRYCLERVLSKTKAKKIMPVLKDVCARDAANNIEQLPNESPLAVYEVPCETAAVSCAAPQKMTIARRALHGFMHLIYAIGNAGSHKASAD